MFGYIKPIGVLFNIPSISFIICYEFLFSPHRICKLQRIIRDIRIQIHIISHPDRISADKPTIHRIIESGSVVVEIQIFLVFSSSKQPIISMKSSEIILHCRVPGTTQYVRSSVHIIRKTLYE